MYLLFYMLPAFLYLQIQPFNSSDNYIDHLLFYFVFNWLIFQDEVCCNRFKVVLRDENDLLLKDAITKNILIITHAFLPDLDGGIIVAYDYANLLVDLGHKTVLSKEYKNLIQSTKFTYIQVPNKYGGIFGCIIMVRS